MFVSAATGEGLDDLLERVTAFFDRRLVPVRLLVPYDQGGIVHRLHGLATDIRQENTPDGTIVDARLPQAEANRYAALRIDTAAADVDALDDDGSGGR